MLFLSSLPIQCKIRCNRPSDTWRSTSWCNRPVDPLGVGLFQCL